ncbi:MAG: glycosyltransferase family 4 protein [Muribaculaceae bacterium]|nr:glycosyltransferase family 4 protein [Muribaculaceae bacterium]
MVIGYDGKRAVRNNTGLGNYSRLLAELLAARNPGNRHLLYTPSMADNPRLKPLLGLANVEFRTPDKGLWRGLPGLWRVNGGITAQARRDGIDLFHGLSGELPLDIERLGKPSVVTIHDVIFRHFPECYAAIDRKIYDFKFARAARAATRVIAISECTARDVVDFYGVDPKKISIVYQGCASQFHRTPSETEIADVRRRYGINGPYIVAIGTVERRKNQLLAIKGMESVPRELSLVIVGRRTGYADELDRYVADHGLASRVRFIDNAPFADLPPLYAGAVCSSYTSRFEGFGIPVIESLYCGTPAIVATGSCLEEAGGPSAPAVDPDDAKAWSDIVSRLYSDPAERGRVASEGRAYVERFNDDDMARQTMDVYRQAIAEYNG